MTKPDLSDAAALLILLCKVLDEINDGNRWR